jgi:transcriptional regulator GlxA family with amidase domain
MPARQIHDSFRHMHRTLTRPIARHRLIVIAVPPVDELDLVGPLQVFSSANRLAGKSIYSAEVVSASRQLELPGEGGALTFLASARLREVKGSFDSALLVCGVRSRHTADPFLSRWLRNSASKVRRLGAVCVGAFLLAQAGLLDGRRATAHWKFGRELAAKFPRVRVEADPLWVKDGNIYTSAGVSAGVDLALAWMEEDCGSALAHEAARELVLFLRRPAGQQQLSVSLAAQAAEMNSMRNLQVWITENIRRKLSIPVLAARVNMSERNFQRVFTRELGLAPSQYVLQTRVEAARRQLELTDRSPKKIAAAVGFRHADLMRRAFSRVLGITPRAYCQRSADDCGLGDYRR